MSRLSPPKSPARNNRRAVSLTAAALAVIGGILAMVWGAGADRGQSRVPRWPPITPIAVEPDFEQATGRVRVWLRGMDGSVTDPRPVAVVTAKITGTPVRVLRVLTRHGEYATVALTGRRIDGWLCPVLSGARVPTDPAGAPPRVAVPDLDGLTAESAILELKRVGLQGLSVSPAVLYADRRWADYFPGQSVYANAPIAVSSAGLQQSPPRLTSDGETLCGGDPQGRWAVINVGRRVARVEANWADGSRTAAVIAGGTALLPLRALTRCSHAAQLKDVAFRDSEGAVVSRVDGIRGGGVWPAPLRSPQDCPNG